MGIRYIESLRAFKLDTKRSTYYMAVVDEENHLGHVYYGKRVEDDDLTYLMRTDEPPFTPSRNDRERVAFFDSFFTEYPGHGLGDFREDCITVRTDGGHSACYFTYDSHTIYKGKPKLKDLPATFDDRGTCTTLEIKCRDLALNLCLVLVYTVFEEEDAITRSARISNESDRPITLTKALSACVDLEGMDYDLITLHGAWGRERHVQRRSVCYGKQGIDSLRGEPGHQNNPFLALADVHATEDVGEVYGFNLVYSGNFVGWVEGCHYDTVRVVMGIHPTDFTWLLRPGEDFTTPELVLIHSDEGVGGMTRRFHDLYRNHLIRGEYRDKKRPILINNWEGTYFDFDTEKLLSIARQASRLGIEMLVMDDGWFGKRKDDNSSLGDWYVNEDKLKGGLKYLVDEVNRMGMEFGIWMEPEMVSPDSDLYRAHPDWAIHIPGRKGSLSRNQYVLDLSRKEVRDYIYESVRNVVSSANIRYVKWDMNRPLTNMGSRGRRAEEQGGLFHRYVLGLYDLLERFTKEFPHVLLEHCSSGGARYDPGMLYYGPQIWCSDNTDAIDRLSIQRGTAMVYPLSSIGAHVSDCPNHAVGRTTPFETRGNVALSGTFGYELDVTKISDEERLKIKEQVELYHKFNELVRRGDYYRIANYDENGRYDCWQIVSKDKNEAMVTFVKVRQMPNVRNERIRLKGMDEKKRYVLQGTGLSYAGGALMHAGISIKNSNGDYKSAILHFISVG